MCCAFFLDMSFVKVLGGGARPRRPPPSCDPAAVYCFQMYNKKTIRPFRKNIRKRNKTGSWCVKCDGRKKERKGEGRNLEKRNIARIEEGSEERNEARMKGRKE